jgi:hypothetical protein
MLKKALGFIAVLAVMAAAQGDRQFENEFRVSSTTFANNGILPISTIHNVVNPTTGLNVCSVNGSAGD